MFHISSIFIDSKPPELQPHLLCKFEEDEIIISTIIFIVSGII